MSARQEAVHEHEFEAAHGLPEALPRGEHILWQGAPDFMTLATRCFHLRSAALYFAVILLVRGGVAGSESGSIVAAATAMVWLLPPVLLALGMLTLMAWLTSRTTVYTITDRRVVMRVGIVLSLTFNLPYSRILAAEVRAKPGVAGDIALTLADTAQIAYVHLWPHARPWRVRRTEPMLRCVADTAHVAKTLADAWRLENGQAHDAIAAVDTAPAAPATTARPTAVPARPSAASATSRFPLGTRVDGAALAGQ